MNLNLTKKESKLLDDVFIYMIDYINDDCFSNSDRKSFDSIYSKLKSVSDKSKPEKTKLIKSDIKEVKKL
tara:strand:+ start:41 stop:250 length:210 start_codon:yes stop_codon:yes gene_type:complete